MSFYFQVLPGEERPVQSLPPPLKQQSAEKDVKKKNKFVPLYSKEGQAMSVVQLPGKCYWEIMLHLVIFAKLKFNIIIDNTFGLGYVDEVGSLFQAWTKY